MYSTYQPCIASIVVERFGGIKWWQRYHRIESLASQKAGFQSHGGPILLHVFLVLSRELEQKLWGGIKNPVRDPKPKPVEN